MTHELDITNTRPCRACKRPIGFIKSALDSKKWFVVDPDVVVIKGGEGANLVLVSTDGKLQRGKFGIGEYGYVDHHATCTTPNAFKRKR